VPANGPVRVKVRSAALVGVIRSSKVSAVTSGSGWPLARRNCAVTAVAAFVRQRDRGVAVAREVVGGAADGQPHRLHGRLRLLGPPSSSPQAAAPKVSASAAAPTRRVR
jgi:hypothetical protein